MIADMIIDLQCFKTTGWADVLIFKLWYKDIQECGEQKTC